MASFISLDIRHISSADLLLKAGLSGDDNKFKACYRTPMSIDLLKSKMRQKLKRKRADIKQRDSKSVELIAHFPVLKYKGAIFAGFWPLQDEINMCPLLLALHEQGERVSLPVTGAAGTVLNFHLWTPDSVLQKGCFGTMEPATHSQPVAPTFIFLPLLAFSARGARLGYGGGYYDRTLTNIRQSREVFACGVAFDEQETVGIPTDGYDVRLDAILTPSGFKTFVG